MSGDLERLARAAAKALTGGHPSKPKSIDYAAVRAVLGELRNLSPAAIDAAAADHLAAIGLDWSQLADWEQAEAREEHRSAINAMIDCIESGDARKP